MTPPATTGRGPADCSATEPLARQLGVFGIWAIALNGTIGAGIFGSPGKAAAETGLYSGWMFVLCALLMTPIVLSFAAVASAHRGTGGPMLYAQTAFGPFVGFQTGWAFYVTRAAASAANISLLVATLGLTTENPIPRIGALAAICGALIWVNATGTRRAMQSLTWLTALKLLPLLAIVTWGSTQINWTVFRPSVAGELPTIGSVGTSIMLLVYAYVGWESAVVPGGEIRNPGRDIPRALLLTLLGVTVLYVLIQFVSVATVPDLATTQERPLVAVGQALFGPIGATLLTIGIVVSVGGNVASAMMSTPRITYAMARHGLLPSRFGNVHPKYGTPAFSIVIYGLAVFGLAASGSFVELAMISVLARLLIYLAVVLASWRTEPGAFALPGAKAIPMIAAAFCVALLTQVTQATVTRTALCLVVGSVLYLFARSRPKS